MRKRRIGKISRKARRTNQLPETRMALVRIAKTLRALGAEKREIDLAGSTAIAAMKTVRTLALSKKHFMMRQVEKWLSKRHYSLKQRRAILQHLARFLTDTPNLTIRAPDHWRFPDGLVAYGNFFVFGTKKRDFGLLLFDYAAEDTKAYFLIDTIQGLKGMNPKEVQRELGKPWFEAIMDHFIASCKPLVKERIIVGLKGLMDPKEIWGHRSQPVYKYVINRYFSKNIVYDSYDTSTRGKYAISYYPLNINRKRVKTLLGLQ